MLWNRMQRLFIPLGLLVGVGVALVGCPTSTTSNSPPTANDDTVLIPETNPVTINVLANDVDDGTLDISAVTVTQAPQNGTATANPDGTITYTPGSGFTGTDTFSYTVADSGGLTSNEAGVTVAVVGDQKLLADDGAEGDRFGFSVSIDGDTAVVGADDAVGSGPGVAYVFVRSGTTWIQQAKLTASDAAAGDWFGFSVSIDGDTAIVGALHDDHSALDAGSVYVFTRSVTNWSQQAKLTASDVAAGDLFGWKVSISGDTVIVGAHADDDNGSASGSAYVFTRSGTSWSEQQKLTAGDAAMGDQFGQSVFISGDTALIGARADDHAGGLDSGSAYVFVRSGTTWSEQAKLIAIDAAWGDWFGNSVSLSGDTAIIGAHRHNANSGSTYVFVRSGTTWTQQEKLTASDTADVSLFGIYVSVHGDTALVGAFFSAYVFTRSGTTWSEQAKLNTSDGIEGNSFGWSVSTNRGIAIVGAPRDDDNGTDAGSAYIYLLRPVIVP